MEQTEALARPLKVLVPLIKDELEAGDSAGIEHYRKAGEMLIEAKEQIPHGEFLPWVERHFHIKKTTASDYMRLAKESQKSGSRTFQTLQEVVRPNREPRLVNPPWTAPVKQVVGRVNVEALAQERQNREKEDRLIRQLAIQLIDIGYKVLAAKLHPDKPDGSREAMARLNKVRALLKDAI